MFDCFTRYLNGRLTGALLIAAIALAGCGTSRVVNRSGHAGSGAGVGANPIPQGHPQVIEPNAGVQAAAVTETGAPVGGSDPVGDPNAHAPPIAQVQAELRQELVAVRATSASYINPLQ